MIFYLLLFVFIVTYFFKWINRIKSLPPGPWGLPFIGYPIDHKNAPAVFDKLSTKYGPIFSYVSFGKLVVILNDAKSIKRVFVGEGEKCADRITNFIVERNQKGNYGIVNANGRQWKLHRRFALTTLRDFGVGKPLVEESIHTEADYLLTAISNEDSSPLDVKYLLNNAVSNVLCQLVFGRRFNYDEPEFYSKLNEINEVIAAGTVTQGIGITSWKAHFIPGADAFFREIIKKIRTLQSFTWRMIEEHKENFDSRDDPSDYIYAFLQNQNKGDPTFTDKQLMFSCNQLFQAGTETTSTTLRYALLYLINFPHIQDRVFEEIKDEVGLNARPKFTDRPKLPFTEAVLLETQRLANLAPFVSREVVADIQIDQFSIPKGSAIIGNFLSAHMDAALFTDPEEFQPQRFLTPEGKVRRDDNLMPFGAGKRVCLGESLAKTELFLFFTALVQKFRFEPVGRVDWKSKLIGITSQPLPFQLIARTR